MSDTINETNYYFKKYCRENNRFRKDVLEALMWFYMINNNADSIIFGNESPEDIDKDKLDELSIKKLSQLKLPLKEKHKHYKKFMDLYNKI